MEHHSIKTHALCFYCHIGVLVTNLFHFSFVHTNHGSAVHDLIVFHPFIALKGNFIPDKGIRANRIALPVPHICKHAAVKELYLSLGPILMDQGYFFIINPFSAAI